MNILILKPISVDWPNETPGYGRKFEDFNVWECSPDHLPRLFRGEYRFLRKEGTSRRAARWHVIRMLSMLCLPFNWQVNLRTIEDLEEIER